jgi:hypothetical protein
MSRVWKAFCFSVLGVGLAAAGCAPETFPTPLEQAVGDSLTSHDAMMGFLENLHEKTGAFTLDTVGASVQGRSLVLLRFSDPDRGSAAEEEKIKVFMYAQQHGDEPSGKEAAIALARDIATGEFTDFLETVDLFLIPQVNPDGSEARQRRNADDMDLNRDHLTLSTPEVRAVHSVFNEHLPEVTLDIHEYGFDGSAWVEAGMYKNFGQQIGALSNANMSLGLRRYAWDRVIPTMRDRLAPQDVYLARYLVVGDPSERFRYSTAALNDGRNSMGIYNSLSFLIEGRNGLTVEDDIRERTRQQLATMKAFATFFSENAAEVKALVEAERASLMGDQASPEVALVMDYVRDPERPTVTVGVVDVETGAEETRTFENFFSEVKATLSVRRPLGYAIPADRTDVLGVLARHGIQARPIDQPLPAAVESYQVLATREARKEDKEFLEVEVAMTRGEVVLPTGAVIVWCDQIQSNLIVSLLEPQSQWGLAPLPGFRSLLEVGSIYPILRIMEVGD